MSPEHRSEQSKWLFPAVVLILAIIVRISYLVDFSHLPYWNLLTVDNYYHHNWATNIAGGNLLGDTTYFRAPFYVYCLAAIYWIVGPSVLAARLFGQAVGLLSILMTFLIGRRLFSERVGLLAALMQAIYPIIIYMEAEPLLDPLFMLLLQFAVYQFLGWYRTRSARSLVGIGLLTGLAAITRPTGLVLIPVLIVAIIQAKARYRLRSIALFMISCLLIILPITVRNLAVADDPVLISSQGGINLYIGNNPEADGISAVMPEPYGSNWQIRDVEERAEQVEGRSLKPGEVSSYWAHEALAWILSNKMTAARLYARKLYLTFCNLELPNNRPLASIFRSISVLHFSPVSFGILLPLALLAIITYCRSRAEVGYLVWFVLIYILAASLFFVNARFRLPWLPYLTLLASAGIFRLVELLHSRRGIGIAALLAMPAISLLLWTPAVALSNRPATTEYSTAGLYFYNRGDYKTALEYYHRAKQTSPNFPEVNLNLGATYFRLANYDSARYYFEREITSHPLLAKGYFNLASLFLSSGELVAARDADLKGLAHMPYDRNGNIVLLRITASDSSISEDSLVRTAEQCAERSREDLRVLTDAAVLLSGRGDLANAERLARRAAMAPERPVEIDDRMFGAAFAAERRADKHTRAQAYHLLGYLLAMRGSFGQAADCSRRAIQLDSLFREPYTNLMQSLYRSGNTRGADSVREEIDRRFPSP